MENEGHNTKYSDAKFDSFNIGRKEKVDFFSKNQPKPRKKIRDWKIFKGKNKFILLGAVGAIILIAIAAVLLWYFLSYLPKKQAEQLSPEEQAYQEMMTNVYEEASNLANTGEGGLNSALAYLNDAANRTDDANEKFSILMTMVDLYSQREMYQEAANFIESADLSGLDNNSMSQFYGRMAYIYEKLGNADKVKEYQDKSYEMRGISPEVLREIENDPIEFNNEGLEDL